MCSATLSWAKSELPRAAGGRTSLTLISAQLKGLMLSPARGMLCNRMGMTFLPGSSIPAEVKLGRLLLLQPPADHRPSGASPGPCWSPYWAGEGRRAALLWLPDKPFHCIWWSKTSLPEYWSLLAPCVRGQRQESHFPSSCAPGGSSLQHLISASSLPAKAKLHIGVWGEIGAGVGGGWNQTTARWGENWVPTGGFSFPVNTQIMLVFGSGGRKTARECKEKGARAGKVQMLVF